MDKIKGVNLPIVPAEPEVVEAFNLYRGDAIKRALLDVDCLAEIETLLAERRRRMSALKLNQNVLK